MPKTDYVQIRISPEVKAALEAKATSLGMTISDYIRFLILVDLKR